MLTLEQDADPRPTKRAKRSRRTIKSASIVIEEPTTPLGTSSVPSTPVVPSSVADAGGGKSQEIPDPTPVVVGSRRRSQASSSSTSAAQWSDADKSGRLLFLQTSCESYINSRFGYRSVSELAGAARR